MSGMNEHPGLGCIVPTNGGGVLDEGSQGGLLSSEVRVMVGWLLVTKRGKSNNSYGTSMNWAYFINTAVVTREPGIKHNHLSATLALLLLRPVNGTAKLK